MPYLVIKPHRASYKEVLNTPKGSYLKFERRDSEWPGWLWCADKSGLAGWIPESWVTIDGDHCTLLRDYSTAELTVIEGETVSGDTIESGWVWVENCFGESGWVPLECLSPIISSD
jgi:hypothetical protein